MQFVNKFSREALMGFQPLDLEPGPYIALVTKFETKNKGANLGLEFEGGKRYNDHQAYGNSSEVTASMAQRRLGDLLKAADPEMSTYIDEEGAVDFEGLSQFLVGKHIEVDVRANRNDESKRFIYGYGDVVEGDIEEEEDIF